MAKAQLSFTPAEQALRAAASVHIMTPSATVRRILNMTALAGIEAGIAH